MAWRRLQLFALAYNLGKFLGLPVLAKSVKHGSLTTLREKLIRSGRSGHQPRHPMLDALPATP